MITTAEVRGVIEYGEVIEDYPEDMRGHSCLMLGFGGKNRPIHILSVRPRKNSWQLSLHMFRNRISGRAIFECG
jgi:hypothetical protein